MPGEHFNRSPAHFARGSHVGEKVRISCTFDRDTFAQILRRAKRKGAPMTRTIQELVEWGLMDAEEERK